MSTAVEKRADGAVEQAKISPDVLARIVEYVKGAPRAESDLGSLLTRIMDCETIDAAAKIFDDLDNTRDVAGVPLMVNSFIVHESKYDDGLPFFMTVFARNRTDESEVVFNTGAATVMISLLTGYKRGWFPFNAHIEMKDLPNGYQAANLVFEA